MKKAMVLLALSLNSFASDVDLDPVVVGSKQESKLSELNSQALIITSEEIENRSNSRVVDVLNRAGGVDIVQNGVVGGTSSLFLRGMESRHVLVLIDGVRMYDPTIADRSINLSILNTLDIERIEVIKGAQSVLYGSDAIAGVINIITKKDDEKNSVQVAGGYYQQVGVNQNLKTDSVGNFKFNGSLQESKFISSAKDGNEKDLNNNSNITLGHFYKKNRLEFQTQIKQVNNFNYTDAQISTPEDDNDAYAKDIYGLFHEGITYHHDQKTDVFFDISYSEYTRYNKYLSTAPSTYGVSDAEGSITNIEFRLKEKKDNGVLLYGLQSIGEDYEKAGSDKESLSMFDAYGVRKYVLGSHIYEYGLRYTTNPEYGKHLVYSLGYNYLIDENRTLKFGHKTGFKAPSIYHQTDVYSGNPDLAPEKSAGADIEYSQRNKNTEFYTSIFYNSVDQLIQYSSATSKFENVNNAKYWGAEFGVEIRDAYGIAGANLTLTQYELSNGKEAYRRPNEILKLNYLFFAGEAHSFNFDWVYRGAAFDSVNQQDVELKAYDLMNFDYTYDANQFKLIGSIKNIFDREYETIAGYSTLGRAVELTVVSYY